MRITISDITGREIRSLEGTKEAGLNRVQWDLDARPAQAAADEAAGGAAPEPPRRHRRRRATAGARRRRPAAAAQPRAGAGRSAAAQTPPTGAAAAAAAAVGWRRPRRLRAAVPAGSYLVKVMVGDKVIGQKTLVVEADIVQ